MIPHSGAEAARLPLNPSSSVSAFAVRTAGAGVANAKTLGALLVEAGKLKPEHAESIVRVQREHHLRFGEAAVRLGLVVQGDIDAAVSRQFDYPYLRQNDHGLTPEVVAAFQPFSTQVEGLRGLRSQLMLRWFDNAEEHKALAVVSPARGEGRSFIAANLAVVFSQLGERTLLIDADLRHPRQHKIFNVDNGSGLSAVLSGRGNLDSIRRITALRDLSLLPAGAQPPNPQELLARPPFAQMLRELATEYDVILVDTPAAAGYADVHTVAARTGGALMVLRTHFTRVVETRELTQNIVHAGAQVIGSVMNGF